MSDQRQPPVDPCETQTICARCAWRQDCHKKYSYAETPLAKCPDYTRDLTLPRED